jgi:tetratricopeptide (TPR) repeat protein
MTRYRWYLVAALAAAGVGPLSGQYPQGNQGHQHDHDHAAGAPVGTVAFRSSCAPAAREKLGRAMALLHSFWYEEAGAAFSEVIAADGRCAFGYWGRAMSRLHPLWAPTSPADDSASVADLAKAAELSRPGTRERQYADALGAYFQPGDKRPFAERIKAWRDATGEVAAEHREDDEAQVMHALALIASGQLAATDTTYSNQRQAAQILEPIFERHPDHPGLAHYLIHAFDSPALAKYAARAAERYAGIAPAVPHAQHMPSHIFIRLGRWEDAIASNRRSADAGRQFEVREGWKEFWDQRAHAWDYLVYAYLQLGRVEEAGALVRAADTVSAVRPPNALTTDYALAAMPARYLLERDRWAEAKALKVRPAPAWRATEGITHFARALGAARSGDAATARTELATLEALETELKAKGGVQVYWSGQVKIQRLAAGAWLALLEGDTTTALAKAREAADLEDHTEKHPVTPGAVLPARELLGDLLLALHRPAEAREAYEAALARQPGRARALAALDHLPALGMDR